MKDHELPAIRLRGHHLLCILTYLGKGYDDKFVANMNSIVMDIDNDREIVIVDGIDDICQPLVCASGNAEYHCADPRIFEADDNAIQRVAHIAEVPLSIGSNIKIRALKHALRTDLKGNRSKFLACSGCNWFSLCEQVSKENYKGCLIQTW